MSFTLVLSGILMVQDINSQTLAVTEHGDTVYIFNDGTWSFEMEAATSVGMEGLGFEDIEIIPDTLVAAQRYEGNGGASVESSLALFNLKYDKDEWKRIPPGELNEDAEFAFQNRNRDIWAMVITEESVFDKVLIARIAARTMQENLGTEVRLIKSEIRTVNGYEILRVAYAAIITDIPIVFDSYYYSNDKGTLQFTCYTTESLWNKYESYMLDFLNGLYILE